MALTFANKITIVRIVVMPFFIAVVLYYSPERDYLRYVALGLFSFAVISDVIDGYIARTRNQRTLAGAILDPLADKILLMSAFICLYKVGISFSIVQFPMWLVVAVISRDAILLLGSMIIYLVHGNLKIQPSIWGKVTAFFQVSCIWGVLVQWPYIDFFWPATAIFTVISGIDYIRNGIKVLNAVSV